MHFNLNFQVCYTVWHRSPFHCSPSQRRVLLRYKTHFNRFRSKTWFRIKTTPDGCVLFFRVLLFHFGAFQKFQLENLSRRNARNLLKSLFVGNHNGVARKIHNKHSNCCAAHNCKLIFNELMLVHLISRYVLEFQCVPVEMCARAFSTGDEIQYSEPTIFRFTPHSLHEFHFRNVWRDRNMLLATICDWLEKRKVNLNSISLSKRQWRRNKRAPSSRSFLLKNWPGHWLAAPSAWATRISNNNKKRHKK